MTDSPIMSSMAALSRTFALTLSILVESRPTEGWLAMRETMETLLTMVKCVENDWVQTPLSGIIEDKQIGTS